MKTSHLFNVGSLHARTYTFGLRLTPAEHAQVKRSARRLRMRPTDFIRYAIATVIAIESKPTPA